MSRAATCPTSGCTRPRNFVDWGFVSPHRGSWPVKRTQVGLVFRMIDGRWRWQAHLFPGCRFAGSHDDPLPARRSHYELTSCEPIPRCLNGQCYQSSSSGSPRCRCRSAAMEHGTTGPPGPKGSHGSGLHRDHPEPDVIVPPLRLVPKSQRRPAVLPSSSHAPPRRTRETDPSRFFGVVARPRLLYAERWGHRSR